MCYALNCYFTYVKRKLASSPHELYCWQRQCCSSPLRRLDSQETPRAAANIHKLRKSVCMCANTHSQIQRSCFLPECSGMIPLVTQVTQSLSVSFVHIKYSLNNKYTLIREREIENYFIFQACTFQLSSLFVQ